jgi:hypothetical protein
MVGHCSLLCLLFGSVAVHLALACVESAVQVLFQLSILNLNLIKYFVIDLSALCREPELGPQGACFAKDLIQVG